MVSLVVVKVTVCEDVSANTYRFPLGTDDGDSVL